MKTTKIITILAVFMLIITAFACAQQSPEKPAGRGGGLPPEAYKACEGKKAGEASQFVDLMGNTVTGVCTELDGKLILRLDPPKGAAGGKGGGLPAEAYKACEGKKAGDASQFVDTHRNIVKGVCEELDGRLILKLTPPGDDNQKK